jgi:hypothetical protein
MSSIAEVSQSGRGVVRKNAAMGAMGAPVLTQQKKL